MSSQPDEGDSGAPGGVLSFTCRDCRQRFTRLVVRGDPSLVSRCFACDGAELRRCSERLLELVFGASAP